MTTNLLVNFIKNNFKFLDDVDKYLQYVGGTPGAIALTTIAAASAYYLASRPVPEKPLVPLDNQCPILEVCIGNNFFS